MLEPHPSHRLLQPKPPDKKRPLASSRKYSALDAWAPSPQYIGTPYRFRNYIAVGDVKMEIRNQIKKLLSASGHWAEVRYHGKLSRSLGVMKGEVSEISSKRYEGVGIRVLVDGTFGFASTGDLTQPSLEATLKKAEEMAREIASRRKKKIKLPATSRLAHGDFFIPGYEDLENMPWEKKLDLVRQTEEKLRGSSKSVESASCQYTEVFEEKIIMTTDGANAHSKLVRPEFRMSAFAADGAKHSRGFESIGVTGAWDCLFQNRTADTLIESASKSAVDLLKAPVANGGKAKVILSPAMVGLLCHEAIGHTVEADFVLSGSVAQGKLNQTVASNLVTLSDSGHSEFTKGAGGTLPFDDEGVLSQRVDVIKEGKLVGYLHNRESAEHFGVEPGGNSRAWEFSDEPLIRMRNTFIQPGTSKLDDMIAGIDEGFFVDGPEGGQADATGEFMFGANRVRRIKNGKLGETVQKLTVAGQAFDVLKTVDAVSSDFRWDLGAGHCGKGQPAKVDAGGPFIRCEVTLGGRGS